MPMLILVARDIRQLCQLPEAAERLLRAAMHRLGFSARAYHRIIKISRTIADLDARAEITAADVAEAIQYRTLDRMKAAA